MKDYSLSDIDSMPTTIDNIHESCYKSYHLLEYVLVMVNRGDSKETITEVVNHLQSSSCDTTMDELIKNYEL